jgi:hypothetical protein
MKDTLFSKPIVVVVRENGKLLDNVYKKMRVFNAAVIGLILFTKLCDTLIEFENKHQKGE